MLYSLALCLPTPGKNYTLHHFNLELRSLECSTPPPYGFGSSNKRLRFLAVKSQLSARLTLCPTSIVYFDLWSIWWWLQRDERNSGALPFPCQYQQCWRSTETAPCIVGSHAFQILPRNLRHQQRMWLAESLHCSHGGKIAGIIWPPQNKIPLAPGRMEPSATIAENETGPARLDKQVNPEPPLQQGNGTATHSTRRQQSIPFCNWDLSYSNVISILSPQNQELQFSKLKACL